MFIICFPLYVWFIKKADFYIGENYVSSKHVNGEWVPPHYEKTYIKIPSKVWIYLVALFVSFMPGLNIIVLLGLIIWKIITFFTRADKLKNFFNKEL